MAPSFKESEIANGLKVNDMLDFFEAEGHNLMLFGNIDSRKHTRKLANQFGVDFENYVSTSYLSCVQVLNDDFIFL